MSDLDRTLTLTRDFLARYVVFASSEQAIAAALWTGHTWMYDQFDTTAYLAVQSAEKRSGKSRLLECLRLLVREPVPMAGASMAALFRIIDQNHPTLLLDEADTIFNKRGADASEDVRGLLNNGYRRGVPYYRVVGDGKKMRVESFDVYSPKCLASIRALPDTVQDRSIVLTLKRRAPREAVERFRFRTAEQQAVIIREYWESLADLTLPEQAAAPDELDDRAADSWEPLLALADVAGGEWPDKARRAALVLSGEKPPEDDTLSVQLLADVRAVFTDRESERLPTHDLLGALRDIDDSPWAEYGRDGLKAHALSRLLRLYGIGPKLLKFGARPARGYDLEQFADAFDRYLPPPPQSRTERYSVTSEHESEHESNGVTDQTPVTGGRPQNGAASLWDGVIRHTCTHCKQPADADELTIRDAKYMHRGACPGAELPA
jgi:hypothetical protein